VRTPAQQTNQGRTFHVLDSQIAARFARALFVALGFKMIPVLRWILFIPAAIAAWFFVFWSGFSTYRLAEQSWCPPEDLKSGFCENITTKFWLAVLMHAFTGLSAAAVGVTAVAVAPAHKERVVWFTLAAGILAACLLVAGSRDWSLFGAASLAGVLSALVIVHLLRKREPNKPLNARPRVRHAAH
jgi:hypothetical protein